MQLGISVLTNSGKPEYNKVIKLLTSTETMYNRLIMACESDAGTTMRNGSNLLIKLLAALILSVPLFSNTLSGQVATGTAVCYGDPINLHCTLTGCELTGATYHWSNSSGSWTSGEPDPVIFAGSAGYATDVFSLNLLLPPPVGGSLSASYSIFVRDSIAIEETQQNVQCYGGSDGAIRITAFRGGDPYSYLWSNGSTMCNLSGLYAGTYTVTVSDPGGCSKTGSYEITGPLSALEIGNVHVTNTNCNGSNEGSIDITVTGGVIPYDFLWSTGETTEDISSLLIGNYTVTVTDGNLCTQTGSWTVAGECDPVCYGQPIYLYCTLQECAAPGATFRWMNASGSWTSDEPDPVIYPGSTGYASDTFLLTLYYSPPEGSFSVGTYMVSLLSPIEITAAQKDVRCFGTAEGSISITSLTGEYPYQYYWSNGSTLPDQTDLPAGTYTVTVTDANNCSGVASYTINEPQSPVIFSIVQVTPADCNGSNEGAIDISVTGGVPPYQFIWSTGDTTEDIEFLTAGVYSVTVNDANGCVITGNWMVNGECPKVCYGQPIYLYCTLPGCPMPGATYLWTNSSGSWTSAEPDPVIYPGDPGYAADVFTLVLQFAPPENGFATGSYLVTIADPIVISGTQSDVVCSGGSDGSIEISVTGGVPPYAYDWSNGVKSCNQGGLSAGTYTVTVTDFIGCSATAAFTIVELHLPVGIADVKVTGTDCNGSNFGTIDITVNGGTPPYDFLWSTGDLTEDIASLAVGDYTVTITDANNCTRSGKWTITGVCQPVCFGQPIYLFCTLAGCAMPGATFLWTNSSGSWTSDESDPVIEPGTPGYAADIFSLTILYSPPEGSFSTGSYQVTLADCIKVSENGSLQTISNEPASVENGNTGPAFGDAVPTNGHNSMINSVRNVSGVCVVKAYPNPTTGLFTLDLTSMPQTRPVQVELLSMLSEKVFSRTLPAGSKHLMSLSDKPCGTYLLRVYSIEEVYTVKIIKE